MKIKHQVQGNELLISFESTSRRDEKNLLEMASILSSSPYLREEKDAIYGSKEMTSLVGYGKLSIAIPLS